MKTFISFLILCLIATCNAELRTWTAINGKEVEAEFVSNEKGLVKLKLESGKVFEVPANKLSKEDNEFISSLAKPEGVNGEEELTFSKEIAYLKDSDTPYTGKAFGLYGNGQKQLEGNYKDGEKDALWTSWYENGQKKGEVSFKDGKPDGLLVEWYENGQKSSEGNYKGGELVEGSEKHWNEKGELQKKILKFAVITNALADFWAYGKAGAQKAASEHDDIEIVFKMGDGTASKQREICDSLLVRGFKGIAISPSNPEGQQEMLNSWAKKASIITVDSDVPESDRLFYLGTNNVEAGRQAGELLKEALPNGGKVMAFVGVGEALNAKERYQGIKEVVEGTKIKIIGLRIDGANISRARSLAEETLTEHPDLAGMIGLWAYNAPACLKAVRDKGFIGKVKIIAFDEEVETLKAIDNGEIHGTVAQQPYELCYQAIKALRSIVVEGKSLKELEVTKSRQKFIPTKIIRKGEATNYLNKLQKWKNS